VVPQVILAADHRARGVITVEHYADYLGALRAALPHCDGILASTQPLVDLVACGALRPEQSTYLSLNRTGLAGSAFELDDRLVATVEDAKRAGYTGVKHMTRIDRGDPATAAALELLGGVLSAARLGGLAVIVEALSWVGGSGGGVDRSTEGIVHAAVVTHDMGAPLLKVPTPDDAAAGRARVRAVRRVVQSVGVPVLFLGGPRPADRESLLRQVGDAMAGGAGGVAIGRAVYQDPDPGGMAAAVAAVVRGETVAAALGHFA